MNNNNQEHMANTNNSHIEENNNIYLNLSLSLNLTTSPPPLTPPSPLLYPSPTHHPLQLSSSHPIYNSVPPPNGPPTQGIPVGPHSPQSRAGPLSNEAEPLVAPSQQQSRVGSMRTRQIPLAPPLPQSRAGQTRNRRNPTQGRTDNVPQPYPWATIHRATVHTLQYLESQQIVKITGEVQCKRCEEQYQMDFDLRANFMEIGSFIVQNRGTLHDRAPSIWMNPVLPTCRLCGQENSVKPIIAEKKKAINWLFLLLGQMLGCCTLEQLKYFCKHTKNHRTGAKDRVLYLTYLALCKQLDPDGPFDR